MTNNSEIWDLFLTLLHYYHDFYHCTCESAHPSLWCCSLFSRYFSNTLQALDISVKWEPAAITIQNKLFNFFQIYMQYFTQLKNWCPTSKNWRVYMKDSVHVIFYSLSRNTIHDDVIIYYLSKNTIHYDVIIYYTC